MQVCGQRFTPQVLWWIGAALRDGRRRRRVVPSEHSHAPARTPNRDPQSIVFGLNGPDSGPEGRCAPGTGVNPPGLGRTLTAPDHGTILQATSTEQFFCQVGRGGSLLHGGLAARLIHPPRRNNARLDATGSAVGLFSVTTLDRGRADVERVDTPPRGSPTERLPHR